MLKLLLPGSILFLAARCAQPPAPEASAALAGQAQSAYARKHYAAAGRLYDQAFAAPASKPGTSGYYAAACSWARAGYHRRAMAYLNKAIAAGWDDQAELLEDEDLASLQRDAHWPAWRAQLEASMARSQARFNRPLRNDLLLIYTLDQAPRQRVRHVMTTNGVNSPEWAALGHEIQAADAQTLPRVTAILKQHGWPSPQLVGRTASLAAFLVIQHADLAMQLKYLPLLRNAAAQGELAKANLALLEDRVRVRQGQPQIYGSQLRAQPATGKLEFEPIADFAHVDARRASVGLEPLADYARRHDVLYPPRPAQ